MISQPPIKPLVSIFIILTIVCASILPSVGADTSAISQTGFSKGVTWRPYVPLKRTTFVNYNTESYLDDYAYLAAVPTTVFYDDNSNRIFTNPLLFFEEDYQLDHQKERTLNARQGIDYFMEDWMGACSGKLDRMTLINVNKNRLDEDWDAIEYVEIDAATPAAIANDLATHEWSYSDDAVIAVFDLAADPSEALTGSEST